MIEVFVTNKSDQDLSDSCAGTIYHFKKGQTVQVPESVAMHVFGYKETDKLPFLARLGWAKTNLDTPKALETLEKFEITLEHPKKDRSLSPAVEQVPLPARAGGKLRAINE